MAKSITLQELPWLFPFLFWEKGVLEAVAPWFLGFTDKVFWPQLIIDVFEKVASVTSTQYFKRGLLSANSL